MFDLDDFEDTFTALAKELRNSKPINVKELLEYAHERSENVPLFRDYNPTVIDFLQRCRTDEEGIEIIEFLAKRGEITNEEKTSLLEQLRAKGIRSFGPLRKPGYYDKEERIHKIKQKQQQAKEQKGTLTTSSPSSSSSSQETTTGDD